MSPEQQFYKIVRTIETHSIASQFTTTLHQLLIHPTYTSRCLRTLRLVPTAPNNAPTEI